MWRWRRRREADFQREIHAHIALEADRLTAEGMSPADARAAAMRRFGNATAAEERFYERSRVLWLHDASRDLRYAARVLIRDRRFSAAAVLTLSLGLTLSVTMFAAVDALLLRTLPYRDEDRVLMLWQTPADNAAERLGVAPAVFLDWRERASEFAAMAALEPYSHDYLAGTEPVTIDSLLVTEGFFDVLGVTPLLGRGFAPEEHQNGRADVAVLSYGFWQRGFNGDPAIVGRSVVLDGRPHTVVGVLPKELFAPTQRPAVDPTRILALETARARDVWAPKIIQNEERTNRRNRFWNVVARLRDGMTREEGEQRIAIMSAALAREFPEAMNATAEPLRTHMVGRTRTPVLVLMAAAGSILLIACGNVSGLLIARGAHRKREFAVRRAIGATRWRLVRQLCMESLVLAAAAATIGVVLARWAVAALRAVTGPYVPQLEGMAIDSRALLFALALAGVSSLVFGVWPALMWSRPSRASAARTTQPRVWLPRLPRLSSVLVVAEVALTLILLVGAGLLVRALGALAGSDPGFERLNVTVLQVFAYGERYRSDAQRVVFFDQATERLRGLTGVESVGLVSAMPFGAADIGLRTELRVPGVETPSTSDPARSAFVTTASPDYFRAMRIPVLRGRAVSEADTASSRAVVVINDVAAARYWPGRDAVGAEVTLTWLGRAVPAEVVGVVAGVRHEGLDRDVRPEVFVPFAQRPFGSMTFVVRSSADPAALIPAMKAQIWALDPTLPFYDVATLDSLIGQSLAARRFLMELLGTFALVALLLATAGLYGVVSFMTAQRTREISVRMAIGAPLAGIVRMVMRQGMTLVGIGVAIGLAGALAMTQLLGALLYSVSPADPVTLTGTAALLVIVAALACTLPALRAARTSPLLALRSE